MAQDSKYHRFKRFEEEDALHEIPGLVLEELLLQKNCLRRIAVDISGRGIPGDHLSALLIARRIDNAMYMREQILYSLLCVSNGTGKPSTSSSNVISL